MELSSLSDRPGPLTNDISGGCFTVMGEHGKGIAVFLGEGPPKRRGI